MRWGPNNYKHNKCTDWTIPIDQIGWVTLTKLQPYYQNICYHVQIKKVLVQTLGICTQSWLNENRGRGLNYGYKSMRHQRVLWNPTHRLHLSWVVPYVDVGVLQGLVHWYPLGRVDDQHLRQQVSGLAGCGDIGGGGGRQIERDK